MVPTSLRIGLGFIVTALLVGTSHADVGLRVGTKAPDFRLLDQSNTQQTLSKLVSKARFTAIVFYRSADW